MDLERLKQLTSTVLQLSTIKTLIDKGTIDDTGKQLYDKIINNIHNAENDIKQLSDKFMNNQLKSGINLNFILENMDKASQEGVKDGRLAILNFIKS